jgi:parallel beta-helix repeat protein
MMIHGFGFLSLSASLVLPWVLTGLVQGQRITELLVKNVRQSSTVQKIPLPSRKLISQVSTPTTYYVSGAGSDKNSGLSPSDAFRNPKRAADITNPGDTVLLMNGVYTNSAQTGSVLGITRSGNANAWITYKAYPGHFPKIQHNTWNGIIVYGASYIEINGLEVIGNNANITLAYALSQKSNLTNPLTNGNCISLDGRDIGVHHIRILNNKVHDCGGAGIAALATDYVTVNNNTVYNNAWYSLYGGSGISLWKNWNSDNNQTQYYKMLVIGNKTYNNQMYVPWYLSGTISDGNGIIVDVSKLNENGAYKGRTLIANNISYNNGGAGVLAHDSEHVDIINNTAYLNMQSPNLIKGQIYAGYSSDVRILNNIVYGSPGQNMNSNRNNINVTYDYNLYPKNTVIPVLGSHDIIADPQFVDPSNGDFRLKATSPAIKSGLYWKGLRTDYAGNPRPVGTPFDIGAYQY